MKIIKIKADISNPNIRENLGNYRFKAMVVYDDSVEDNPYSSVTPSSIREGKIRSYICGKCRCKNSDILTLKYKELDEI